MTYDGLAENIAISIMSGVPDADVYIADTQIAIPDVFSGNFLTGMLYSNDTAFAAVPTQTLNSPKTLETLNFIGDLYNVDKTTRTWDNPNWEINNNLFAKCKSGFWIPTSWLNNEQGANLPFDFGMVSYPVGPSGNEDTNAAVNTEGNCYFIPQFI